MKNKELYGLSKRVYKEAILHAQIQSAGSNQQKYLERIKTDKIARSPDIIYKSMAALYIGILTVIPILSVFQMYLALGKGVSFQWIVFAGSIANVMFFVMQIVLLIVFALMVSWGIMSGGPYEWIQTLPFERKDIQRIGLFTFVRAINLQLIVMSLVLPVGITVAMSLAIGPFVGPGKIILTCLITILISFTNTAFNLGILVILSRKLAVLLEEYEFSTKKSNFIRIFTMLAYFIVSMFIVLIIQFGIRLLPEFLFLDPVSIKTSRILNNVLSFVPLLLSAGYLLTIFIFDMSFISVVTIVGSVVGFMLYMLLTYLIVKKALKTLTNISSTDFKRFELKRKKTELTDIKIEVTSPTRAFWKRDMSRITREMQLIVVLIMPIMIPVYSVIMRLTGGYMMIPNTRLTDLFILLMVYVAINTYMMIIALTNIETGGETITAALPINTRNQIKSKLPYFFSILIFALMISVLLLYGLDVFYPTLYLSLAFLPALPLVGISSLLFKIRMFGKLRYKYVIEEIKIEHKVWKYILGFVFICGLFGFFIYCVYVGYWVLFTAEAVGYLILLVAYNYMFPKEKWVVKYLF